MYTKFNEITKWLSELSKPVDVTSYIWALMQVESAVPWQEALQNIVTKLSQTVHHRLQSGATQYIKFGVASD